MKLLLLHCPAVFHQKDGKAFTADIWAMPAGLIAIANKLRSNGFTVQVLHLGLELRLAPDFMIADYVKAKGFDVVGLTIHWHKQAYFSLATAHKIKKRNRNTFIMIGGFTASYFADELMREHKYVDGVIRGDGELPTLALLEQLRTASPALDQVPNLTWRKGRQVIKNPLTYVATAQEINELDFADLSALKNRQSRIFRKETPFFLVPGRGCAHDCTFCGGSKTAHRCISGRDRVILQKPEKVLATIIQAHKLGWQEFYLPLEPFPDSADYTSKIFKLIRKKQLKLSLIIAPWNLPSEKLINELSKTFTKVVVEVYAECYSEKIRRFNKDKGLFYTNNDLENKIAYMVKKGMTVSLMFGYFLPFEKLNDIFQTLRYFLELRERFGSSIKITYSPYPTDPGAKIFLDPKRYKLVTKARKLKDYLKYAKEYNRAGYAGSMLLYRPVYFSKKQAKDIGHLVTCVHYLDKIFVETRYFLNKAMGWSYLKIIKLIYSELKQTRVLEYEIPVWRFRDILHKIIRSKKEVPGFIQMIVDWEAQDS